MEKLVGKGRYIRGVGRGLVTAFLTTVILLLGLAFLLLKLQWDTGKTEIAIMATYIISCFAGGWFCGRRAERMKFLWGMLTGVLYFLLLLAVSVMGEQGMQSDLATGAVSFLLCAAGGMVGGMLS